MKKIIKKLGGSNAITFSKEELKIYNLSVGNIIDIDIIPEVKDGE